ncbi:MAG: N-acetylmuramoyl-L-alanine amidase-like domain-containing protein [Verrucomicrobiota bacterium]
METSRRRFLLTAASALAAAAAGARAGIDHLPLSTSFKGVGTYQQIMLKAQAAGWAKLPIGQRMAKLGRECIGIPYVGYTLEIDDRIECPSANFQGLDCWTFFEIVLGMARLLERPKTVYTPQDLLKEIQWTRYRAGVCTGKYLERIHYLNEWFIDNEARGAVKDITRQLGGAIRLYGRESREMTVLWKGYRYLRNNPELRPKMAEIEQKVNALPVWYIPKSKVAAIESKLADGDIAGIVTKDQGGVCSHVGLITRQNGEARFMHASKNYHRVVIDQTISKYLNTFASHAGLIVARPLPVGREVTSRASYEANLRALGA